MVRADSFSYAFLALSTSEKSAWAKPRGQPVLRSTATRTSVTLSSSRKILLRSASDVSYGMLPIYRESVGSIGVCFLWLPTTSFFL